MTACLTSESVHKLKTLKDPKDGKFLGTVLPTGDVSCYGEWLGEYGPACLHTGTCSLQFLNILYYSAELVLNFIEITSRKSYFMQISH